MKKKLKILACALLIIPCMFIITGCKKADTSISQNEYAKLVVESGRNYFESYNNYEKFGNMKLTSNYEYSSEFKESFTYKENVSDEQTVTKLHDIKSTSNIEQCVSIYNVGSGETADIYVEVTEIENKVEKGYRVKEDNTLESYEETSVATTTYLFVKDVEEYKCFTTKSSKEGDAAAEVTKTYYTYATREDYIEQINTLLTDVNQHAILAGFYPDIDSEMTIMSLFGEKNTYKDGNEFGYDLEIVLSTFNDEYEDELVSVGIGTKFKNNKPSATNLYMLEEGAEGKGEYSVNLNILYKVNAISKPADTTSFVSDSEIPTIYIQGVTLAG